MKTSFIFVVIWLPLHALSQGHLQFNNFTEGLAPVTISSTPGTFNPADGLAGAYVGSDYAASLFYVLGTVTNQTVFDNSNPTWVTAVDARFFGTTGTGSGHGWDGDGSGFFDGGVARFNFALTTATFQVRVWNNGGGLYTSYEQAASGGHNVGQSNLLPLFVDAPPGPAPGLSGLMPFTVGIPEPSTFVLAALGGAALFFFRRRK